MGAPASSQVRSIESGLAHPRDWWQKDDTKNTIFELNDIYIICDISLLTKFWIVYKKPIGHNNCLETNANGLKWRRPSTWNDLYLEFVYYFLSCGLHKQSPNKLLNSSKFDILVVNWKSRKIYCYLKTTTDCYLKPFNIFRLHLQTRPYFVYYLYLILTCLLNFSSFKETAWS